MLDGKVVVITGAGRGIGRAHAMAVAELGASVVVNDLGTDVSGNGAGSDTADDTVRTVVESGGVAVADYSDVSTWDGCRQVVQSAIDTFGRIDGLVNNAGIMRAAPVDEISEDDLDSLIGTHVKGTYGTTRHACAYWRALAEAGHDVRASVVNTVSEAMLVGLPRYAAYSGMKAAIATLTVTLSLEGADYGVRANAYAPRAATRMMPGFDRLQATGEPTVSDPGNSSPLVAWLLSEHSAHVSGQVFQTVGGAIAACTPWTTGELAWPTDGDVQFSVDQVGTIVESQLQNCRFSGAALVKPPGWPQPA